MGDLTPRLDLYLPGGGSSGTIADEPADIDKLNDNFRRLDGTAGALPVTSTTRPPTPFEGQLIYETDTGFMQIWRAGAWASIGNRFPVRGAVRRKPVSSSIAGNAWAALTDPAQWEAETPPQGLPAFNGTWVIPVTGRYRVEAGIQVGAAVPIILGVGRNNAAPGLGMIFSGTFSGTAGWTAGSIIRTVLLQANDVLRLHFYGTYAGGAGWTTENTSWFNVELVEQI